MFRVVSLLVCARKFVRFKGPTKHTHLVNMSTLLVVFVNLIMFTCLDKSSFRLVSENRGFCISFQCCVIFL